MSDSKESNPPSDGENRSESGNNAPDSRDSIGSPGTAPLTGTVQDSSDVVVGKVISESESPNLKEVEFRILPGRDTSAGRILGVRGERPDGRPILTLVRVDNVWENNPHEDAQSSTISDAIPMETRYAEEGKSTVIYRAARAETLEEIVLSQDGDLLSIESVETLPRAGNSVVKVDPGLISQALNLAQDSDEGLDMGNVVGLPDTPAILNREIAQTHILFVGGIGRGKSYARGVLGEELAAHGVPQINLDPMGELVPTAQAVSGGINVRPGEGEFTMPLSALTSQDVLNAIPGINESTNYATLISYAHEDLRQEKVLQRNQSFGVDDLLDRIREVAPKLDMDNDRTIGIAIQRTNTLRRLPYIGDAFPWKEVLEPGRIVNIDARGQLVKDLRLVAAAVARDIQRLAKARKIPFVVLSFDEAHLIAPNEDIVTTQVLREIARIGRHYRIGLILTTQSPSDMDRSVLKRMLTRFIFALEPDQLDSLRGVFSDAPDALIDHLPKLPRGRCLVTGVSETIKHATVMDIRERKTPDGGETPDVFDDLANRGWQRRKDYQEFIGRRQ